MCATKVTCIALPKVEALPVNTFIEFSTYAIFYVKGPMIIYVSKLVARSLLVRQYFFRTLHRRLNFYQDFEDIVAVLKLSAQLDVNNTSMQFK